MLIEKLYFRWNRALEFGKYQLDDFVSEGQIEKELTPVVNLNFWYKIKVDPSIQLKIDDQCKIESKFFRKNSKIGNFEISWKFIDEVKREFESELEKCDKAYSGDKLILHFGDKFLHAASLTRTIC